MPEKPNVRLGVEQFLTAREPKLLAPVRALARVLDRCLSWSNYNRFADQLPLDLNGQQFLRACTQEFDLQLIDEDNLLDQLPRTGPLIIISNHPTGFMETVAQPDLIMQVRPDLKILANEMLADVHWLQSHIIPLNVFKTTGIKQVMHTATQWLNEQGALLIYPSGEVADYQKQHGRILDGEWSRLPLLLAEKTGAKIVHLHIAAKTTRWFRLVTQVCRSVRTLWMMKELYRQGGKSVSCYSSSVMALSALPDLPKAQQIELLHALNDCLPLSKYYQAAEKTKLKEADGELKMLAQQVDIATVRAELEQLPESTHIYTHQAIVVYVAKGKEIPNTLQYIQVERERVFRQVGQGTGQPADADCFDEEAWHVVVWNTSKQDMIASTRCHLVSQHSPRSYLDDLYTIDHDRLLGFGEMLVVSRTFVLTSYQRSFSSLLCLWRGLSQVVLRHEGIRFVAGVVSVKRSWMSPPLLDCLTAYVNCVAQKNQQMASLFQARYPYQPQGVVPAEVERCLNLTTSVTQLEYVFKELIKQNFQLPVLFRQYESLGTLPLAVSVDDAFASCIDVLHVWDTHDLSSSKIRLFFGDTGLDMLAKRAKMRDSATH